MPGGKIFNSLDTDLEDENSQEQVDDLDDDLEQDADQLDEEMLEAERRINLAGYYRQLAQGGIFKDGSEEAKIVDSEVRAFARERMAVLLNMPSAPKQKVELPFTETQIEVLQWLADRYYEKQKAQPVIQSPAPPAQPQPVQALKPKAPVITPLAPPAGSQKAPTKPKKERKPKVDYSKIADGEVFEENGKHWKFVTNPETKERIKMGVSLRKQVTPPHRRPMPSERDMEMLSAQQAQQQTVSVPVVESDKRVTING